jgi:hypothetical protein
LEFLEQRNLFSVFPLGDSLSVTSDPSAIPLTFGQCRSPVVAMETDGSYVAVWTSQSQDGANAEVYAQRFNASGARDGDPLRVNTCLSGMQTYPNVAIDANGNFVVTWSSLSQDGSGYGIYAQRFDAAGQRLGSEFRVNAHTAGNQDFSAVAMAPDGQFVVTWTSQDQDGDRTGIYGQRFDAAGNKLGGEFRVNTTTAGNQRYSTVAMDSAGRFVVSWTSQDQDGSSGGIYARCYAADGQAVTGEVLVNTTTEGNQQFSAIVMDAGGEFTVAWQSYSARLSTWEIRAQRFNAAGARQGEELLLGQGRHVALALDGTEAFVTAWETYGTTPSAIVVQHFDNAGNKVGSPFTISGEAGKSQQAPSIAMSGERMAALWSGNSASGGQTVSAWPLSLTIPEGLNLAPSVAPIADQTVDEGSTLSLTVTATDPNAGDTLQFSLADAPQGVQIDATSGLLTWTPSESQGPGSYLIRVRVTDSGTPALSGIGSFKVTVGEVSQAPQIDPILDQTIPERQTVTFTVVAHDPDVPAGTLTYSLEPGAPAGASIGAQSGVFSWQPTEAQGPATYSFTVRVTDSGNPALSATRSFAIRVTEVNDPPQLATIADQTIDQGQTLALSLNATDPDIPPHDLVFSVDEGAPTGVQVDPITGALRWVVPLGQTPDTYHITVRVTDNGSPALSDAQTFSVVVNPAFLEPVADQSISEGQTLSVGATLTAPYVSSAMDWSLEPGAPEGAQIDPSTGVFTWTPGESQGSGVYTITIRATDRTTPALTDTVSFQVSVGEVNSPPVLTPIPDQSILAGETLSFSAAASDPDLPAGTLRYRLAPGAPEGAQIDAATGVFTWTPPPAQAPGWYEVTVVVADDATPGLEDSRLVRIEVRSLPPVGGVDWGTLDFFQTAAAPAADGDRYTFHTAHNGLLTVEAMLAADAGNVDLSLVNAAGNVVATSTTATDHERLDVAVVAGEKYTLVITGANSGAAFRVTNLLERKDAGPTVYGTQGEDVLLIEAGSSHRLSVNGVAYDLGGGAVSILSEGYDDRDAATLVGTNYTESLTLRPGVAELDGPRGKIQLAGVPRVTIRGVKGRDAAYMFDSAGVDQFNATKGSGRLWGAGFDNRVEQCPFIFAYSTTGGRDAAELFDSTGDDTFVGTQVNGTLSSTTYLIRARRFEGVQVHSTAGGNDQASLYDSPGTDAFVVEAGASTLSGPGYKHQAIGFHQVFAFANAGGLDAAHLHDTPGDDRFTANPQEVKLQSSDSAWTAYQFERVFSYSLAGGFDVAELTGGAGNDTFVGMPQYGALSGSGYLLRAKYFDEVHAWAGEGGQDVAELYDSRGDDVFKVSPQETSLSGSGFLNVGTGFKQVTATSGRYGRDTAYFWDTSADDRFIGMPTSAALQGGDYKFVATNFDYMHAYATAGGSDYARLFDSAGDDIYDAATDFARLRSKSYVLRAKFFEKVLVTGRAGGLNSALLTDAAFMPTIGDPTHWVLGTK